MGATPSAVVRTGFGIAGALTPLPVGPVGDLLAAIVQLCETVPKNRHAAEYLAQRCTRLCHSLVMYEKMPFPQRTVPYRDEVFKCLKHVKDKMAVWSGKSWFHMLVYQGEFEADVTECDTGIMDCLTIFMMVAQMEGMARQKEEDEWRKKLMESLEADKKAAVVQFSAPNFMQRVQESELTKDDQRVISTMMQRSLQECGAMSEVERTRLKTNLHNLLSSSKLLPPNCQLNSGEVQWSDEIPTEGSKNADIYKGRYLHSEDVRIKVFRSVNMKDEETVKRVRREVDLWAKIYELDQGEHIIPFYGFYSPNGLSLALVSPWIANGDVLEHAKKYDELFNYKKFILGIAEGIKVLHSMDPPVIHGNLRAKKVLIGNSGKPLITDFALAKFEGNSITQTSGESDRCRWCGPESFNFDQPATVSAKGDIYSFGMTILELFTHDVPYANIKINFHVISKKLEKDGLPDRPTDKHVIDRGLDDRMWEVIRHCCSVDPKDRPSIEELVTQLSTS